MQDIGAMKSVSTCVVAFNEPGTVVLYATATMIGPDRTRSEDLWSTKREANDDVGPDDVTYGR